MNSINFKTLGLGMFAVLAISSCVKENPVEPQTQPDADLMTITLSTEIRTKTVMTPGVTRLSWTEGDSFDLFSNGGDSKTTPVYESDDAVIEAGVDQGATEIYAIYPSKTSNTKAEVAVEIPSAQTQTVAGQMNGANIPMYAKGVIEDGAAVLSFRPVAGIIALNIYSTEPTEAKVQKVQVNPLDSEGNFVGSGYCGGVTTSADGFAYAPTAEVRGVTLTLDTPCSLPSEKPADQDATMNFDNQIYIGMARGTYAGLQFIVTTDDGKMYVATSRTERSFENTDIHYINLNIAGKDEISDDFYGQYNAGLDLTICGNVINKKTHPKAQLKTMSEISWDFLGSALDHPENGGVLFIENSERAYKATAANRTIGKDRIIIGRYRNEHQPIFKINGASTYVWTLDGKVMMKNINLCSYQTSRCLFLGKSGAAHGASEFYFEDCTLTNTNTSYGIFIELNASCAVPKSMRFDNCILRANAAFFGASGRKNNAAATEENAYFASMQNLKSLTFNDCVFAPATLASGQTDVFADAVTRLAVKGVLVALYHNNYRFDDLDISFSHCSSYDLAPSTGAVGMVDVTSVRNLNFDHCMFYNSGTIANMWLSNTVLKCIGATYTVSATYSNKIGSNMLKYGPKSNFIADGGTVSASITEQNDLFGTCEPAKHYFPKSETFTKLGGASYDTKYWIVPTSAE